MPASADSSPSGASGGTALRHVPLSDTASIPSDTMPRETEDDSRLLDLYYQYFHPSHPFVLPQRALRARLQSCESSSLRQLANVMRYIGSFYKESLPESTEYEGHVDYTTMDGFTVQATLLLALTKSMCDDSAGATGLLALGIAQATGIGMNTIDFANAVAGLDPVLAESWRRTWWMIYVVDTNFAIIRWDFHQLLADHTSEVDLPCDEARYNRLVCPA